MIEVGDLVPGLTALNYDASGNLADSTTQVLTIALPGDSTFTPVTPTVNHLSTGSYGATYYATRAGTYTESWVFSGANPGAYNDTFTVESPAQSIVSLAEVKTHLRINTPNDDSTLRLLSLMASDLCESSEGTNRLWRSRTITGETVDAGGFSIQLRHTPVTALTAVRVAGQALDLTTLDYQLPSTSGLIYNATGFISGGRGYEVSVDYVAGAVTTIPPAVRLGTLEMVRHLYAMHRGGSQLPRQGDPDYTQSLGVAYLIPNRVAMAWRAHRASGIG
jgi:uncharacterized phiE125 gp8 family phage protein